MYIVVSGGAGAGAPRRGRHADQVYLCIRNVIMNLIIVIIIIIIIVMMMISILIMTIDSIIHYD